MSSDTLVATPDEPKQPDAVDPAECYANAKRCLVLAEASIGNPTWSAAYLEMSREWRSLGAFTEPDED